MATRLDVVTFLPTVSFPHSEIQTSDPNFSSVHVCGTITISYLVSGTDLASRDISEDMGTGQGANEPFF